MRTGLFLQATPYDKLNQKERVLKWMLEHPHRDLDPLTAWQTLGIYRLSAVVFNLKADHPIINVGKKVYNRFGEDCKVAAYRMKVV